MPYILAISIVVIYTGMYVISKAAFDHGINTFVFIFYRQAAASVLLLPIALVLEWKNLRSLSFWLLLKLFFCALIGNTIGQNLSNASVKFTSATVASAIGNSSPVITFCLALRFRMEVVKLRSSSGVAKVTGVALCLAGALVTALYTGPSFSPVNRHRAFGSSTAHASKAPSQGMWIAGTFLMLLSIMTWSLWIVLQAALLKEFPNKMLITTAQSLFSVLQSFVAAVVAERDFSKWKLHLDVSLLAVLYTGFLVTGVASYLQTCCMEMKGPVFLTAWSPLVFVLTIFCSSFFLGEVVHLGSIIGGLLLVGGLYSMLWGKSMESKVVPHDEVNSSNVVQNEQEQTHQRKTVQDMEDLEEPTSTIAIERV